MKRPSFCTALVGTVAMALLWSGTAGTAAAAPPNDLEAADRIMNLGYQDFVNHPEVPPFDWSNDGCSGPVGPPAKQMFQYACEQHDFGYGNYGPRGGLKLDVSEARRAWIDERFWHEMRNICNDHYPGLLNPGCLVSAEIIYKGVREYGGDHW
ncbi:phospholipase A2 [Streptomyces sp. NPDC021093]|uniref:phospholipase A2 n=1 Tax=Streptomyces sp. NPDC021093 TaxID=3365112 RepID=UPI003788BB3A